MIKEIKVKKFLEVDFCFLIDKDGTPEFDGVIVGGGIEMSSETAEKIIDALLDDEGARIHFERGIEDAKADN